jgi:hypothetical protein
VLSGAIKNPTLKTMLTFTEGGDIVSVGEVNFLTVVYAENGGKVGLVALGDSTDVDINVQSKGNGSINITAGNAAGSKAQLQGFDVVLLPEGTTGVAKVNTDQIVTLIATQTLANKTINASAADALKLGGAATSTVALLNSLYPPNTANRGRHTTVIDSTVAASGNFGAVVAGGGSNVVPVYCDGTDWRIG